MAEFKVPELGENVAGGDVTRVLVKVGDTIALEQPVLELETDKATIEIPSSVAGRVTDIKVKQGDKVNVGAVVLSVEDGAGKAAEPPKAEQSTKESEAAGPVAGGPPPSRDASADRRDGPPERTAQPALAGRVAQRPALGGGWSARQTRAV